MIAFNPNSGTGGVRPPIGGGYGGRNGGGNIMQMMKLKMLIMKLMMRQFQMGGGGYQQNQFGNQGFGFQNPGPVNYFGGAQAGYFA